MAFLQFKKGAFASLPAQINEGTVYVTTDEKAMYVDISATERIRLGQIVNFPTLAAFKEYLSEHNPPYSQEAFYYIEDKNALLKWKSSSNNTSVEGEEVDGQWVQINTTSDVEADLSALDARVTKNESDISTLNTKVKALEDDHLVAKDRTELEGLITEAKNAADDAQDAADAAQGEVDALEGVVEEVSGKVNTNIQNIAGLRTDVNGIMVDYLKAADKTELTGKITTAQNAANTAQNTIDTHIAGAFTNLSNTVSGLAESKADKTALAEVKTTAEKGVADAAAAQADATQALADAAAADAKGAQGIADAAKVAGDLSAHIASASATIATLATKDELTAAKSAILGQTDDGADFVGTVKEAYAKVEAEKSRAEGEEAKIREEFADADTAISDRIDDVDNDIAGLKSSVGAEGKEGAFSTGLYLYAEEKAAAAETAAKSHAEQKASAAETAAKSHADSVAATAKSEANSYTDGKIAAVNTKIGEVEAEITAAEGRAAADATTKANAAQAAAEATAAADATTKANAAQAAAIADANGKFATVNAAIGVKKGENNAEASTGLYKYAEDQAAAALVDAKAYVDDELRLADAMKFQGVLGNAEGMTPAASMPAAENVNAGDTYKVGEYGEYAGIICYAGDLLIAKEDGKAEYVRVSSGYEADYDATLDAVVADKKVILKNGLGTAKGSVTFAAADGASVVMEGTVNPTTKIADTTVTIGMVWGEF